MTPSLASVALTLSLLLLAGCASTRGADAVGRAPALPAVTVDEFLAMQPAERTREIGAAERERRLAERRAERAGVLVPVAETQLRVAQADADGRKAAVERANARVALVRREHQAVFAGVPTGSQTIPEEVQQALRRLDEVEHAVEVARWEQEAALALVRVRQDELAYAQAFRDAAQRDAEMQRAQAEMAKMQLVTRATADILPGIADPRYSMAQSRLREAQASYAKAHAEAMTRLASAQVRRAGMASYRDGPPEMLSLSGAGRSGSSGLSPRAMPIEPEPLPWPNAWEEPPSGQAR